MENRIHGRSLRKNNILRILAVGLFVLLAGRCSPVDAESFSEYYRYSNRMAFLENGNIVFERRNQLASSLMCTNEDGEIIWEVEIPWSEYGGTALGQAGDHIVYAYRSTDDQLVLVFYSLDGNVLSTQTAPQRSRNVFLLDDQVCFVSENSIRFCNEKGMLEPALWADQGKDFSLYKAVGCNNIHVFCVSENQDVVLLATDQDQKELWTYCMENVDVFSVYNLSLAVSPEGCVTAAYFKGQSDNELRMTVFNYSGQRMWEKDIVFPEMENCRISQIRMNADGTVKLWGSYRISSQTDHSWRVTIDSAGEMIEKAVYPKWVDVVFYTDNEPYGVIEPLDTCILRREEDIDWIIQ